MRLPIVLAVFLAGLATATAQTPQITVDPKATVNVPPRTVSLLTGLYATLATVEICEIEVMEPAATGMAAHRRDLESQLSLDEPAAEKAYDAVHADVEKSGLDCAAGSADREQADAIIAIYSGQ